MDFRGTSWLLSGVRFVVLLGALFAMLVLAVPASAVGAIEKAEEEERALRFDSALVEYEKVEGAVASQRIAWLRARSEGDFGPLATLERTRRDPSVDIAAIDRLMSAAEGFPPGLVRLEAWMFGAETYERLGRTDLAVPLWKRVADGDDPILRAAAAGPLVRHRLARGDRAGAREDAGDDAALVRLVRVASMRHRVRLASLVVIATTFVLGTIAVVRAPRSHSAVSLLSIVAVVAYVVAGGLLARQYEGGSARPFLVLGLALLPILLLARAWGAAGSRSLRARAMRAALCAASALGAAFVVLEQVDAAYLEGLGL
jgi:hypothetical protein